MINLFQIKCEHVFAFFEVRARDMNFSVKPAGAHNGRIQFIFGNVSSRDHDNIIFVLAQAVHFGQKLIHGRIHGHRSAVTHIRLPGARKGINFIDEDNASAFKRGHGAGLLK